ncbi:amino acid ABC transporter permease [Microbacterium kribbense]|uniref:Amino acid ABC transporter permease n=1 Tax=Microbacterium kribbense TaxID=433645 RepID=A0ABP7G1R1_9MICO
MSDTQRPAGATPVPPPSTASIQIDRGETIRAVRQRHPWRVTIAVVLIFALLLFVLDAAERQTFQWDIVGKYLFDTRVTQGALITLALTVTAMIIGILLGLLLAVMRLSPNPIVKWIAWAYLWVFRGTPVYVQLVFWGLITLIYKTINVGIPFVHDWAVINIDWTPPLFLVAMVGLALNESAYMAEIVRAGLLSVNPGQEEAATALGMPWGKTMRRIVIPQAMRVIIPPTGNEVISMLKTTSLVVAVPYSLDLFGRTSDISARLFAPIPLLIVASLWYLFFTSVLMIGQYFVEKRFARGTDRSRPVLGLESVTVEAVGIDVGGKG